MSRIENKKFFIQLEFMDIRDAVKEVTDIMRFQLQQKKLKLDVKIDDNVPQQILSDLKRYKQILFNLVGNASKFTFIGGLKIKLNFDSGNKVLLTSIEDSGIGI